MQVPKLICAALAICLSLANADSDSNSSISAPTTTVTGSSYHYSLHWLWTLANMTGFEYPNHISTGPAARSSVDQALAITRLAEGACAAAAGACVFGAISTSSGALCNAAVDVAAAITISDLLFVTWNLDEILEE